MKRLVRTIISALRDLKHKITVSEIERYRKAGVKIGNNVHVLNSFIDPLFPFLVEIGNNVTLTDVKILAHDASTFKYLGYTKFGRVSIGNNVFLGAKTVVLPNVRIGNNVIIGAGSIVSHDIPDNVVAVGNPCKVICAYDEYMEKHQKAMRAGHVINKKPSELTTDEKAYIANNINGIWYIR